MAYPVPAKAFLQPSSGTAMLFAPFECTNPPPPVPPFLLRQNLVTRNIASEAESLMVAISTLRVKQDYGVCPGTTACQACTGRKDFMFSNICTHTIFTAFADALLERLIKGSGKSILLVRRIHHSGKTRLSRMCCQHTYSLYMSGYRVPN